MLTEWLLVGLGVLLTAGTAVFVAAEFALVTLDPGLVDRDLAGQQDIRASSVRKALRQLSTQLSGAQVGITVTTILLGYTAQPALATLLTGPLDSTPLARGGATGLSRFPVSGDSHDDVLGLVHLRRAISVPYERRAEVPAPALMDPAPRVPETVTLGPLLVELREHGLQMAVVVDEYGGTSGVVTLEDVVEELVGDVADEHDPRRVGVHPLGDGVWSVPGLLRPDELTEQTGLVVPEEGAYETLGGLVMALLGSVPVVGDVVQVTGVMLRVEAMDGRRVTRVRVSEVTA